ncbi:MAG TPA: hypothetical protein VGB43_00530 [Flavobacterium sp.]|jgi:hypothetical protein
MKFPKLKSALAAFSLAALMFSCKESPTNDRNENNSDKIEKGDSETMDTGKSSDSIIRTNSADGTDSGM